MRQHDSRASRVAAERRTRSSLRGFASGAALTALALAAGFVAPIANATPEVAAPRVHVVSGDRALSAAWSAVPTATSYTLRVATGKSFAHARTLTTTHLNGRIAHLVNGRTYWVGVTANTTGVAAAAVVSSPAVKAVAAAGVPYPTDTVNVVSGPEENQVTVSWTGGGRATKVGVVAGSSVLVDQRTFHSPWYPATTRSITITVPEEYRAYLGAGTGNPVWVRVVQSNSASTAFGAAYSYALKYRPSPIGQWAFAKAIEPAAATTPLTVAELNTQSVGSTVAYSPVNHWSARAPRVAAYIEAAQPDLLTTAELATNVLDSCRNTLKSPYLCASHTQVADLASRLTTLRLAGTDVYARVMDEMRGFGGKWNGEVTDGAHVFYNPTALTLLDHGYFSPALTPAQSYANVTGLGVSNWTGSNAIAGDRWASWAKFRTNDGTNREFYAVAAHFPVGDASVVVNARWEEGHKLVAAIDALAGNLPVVFGGDLNADAVRNAKPAQVAFMQDGWFDAAAVADKSQRTGMKVSTANGSGPQVRGYDEGYGPKPVWHPWETSRIDYILLRNSPYTFHYSNVLRLDSSGDFIRSLQGTDHNMQLARIGIADPPAAG